MAQNQRVRKQNEPKTRRIFMPGYDLPKGTRGLLSWKWAEQRLKKTRNYWIVTVRPDGRPHVMVVWGLWFGGVLYFSTGRRSHKARNIARNPNIAICTEQAGEAVILEGVAREVPERKVNKDVLTLYNDKYDWDMRSLANVIYAVYPSAVLGLNEKKGPQSATRWKLPA